MYRELKSLTSAYIKVLYNIITLRAKYGFIDSIEKWIHNKCRMRVVFEAQPEAWSKIFSKECELWNFDARFRDKKEFIFFNDIRWCLCKEVKIFYISKAILIGDNAHVLSPDGRVFKELTYPISGDAWRHSDFLGKTFLSPMRFKFGWYTSLVSPTSHNYFHWMMECLPRLAILAPYIGLLGGIIIPAKSQAFHYESLRAFGVEPKNLIEASPRLHLKVQHFFTTNFSARDNPPPWLHVWYKQKIIERHPPHTRSGRKIYISRADAARPTASNSSEIESMVAALGLEIIILSQFSFTEQAAIFYNSDLIVGEHGAGLVNLLFCRAGTKIVEILGVHRAFPCFYAITVSAGLEYHNFITGVDRNSSASLQEMEGSQIENRTFPYEVDVKALREKILEVL